jgi:hypothetical protein
MMTADRLTMRLPRDGQWMNQQYRAHHSLTIYQEISKRTSMTTSIKEKILDISLNLFILNGYKSTTVINLIFDGFTDAMKNGDRIEIRDLEVIL